MAQHIESIRWYVTIWAWLMGLLVLTVVAAFFDLGTAGLAIALTIAFIKALLVVLYFMHVRYGGKLVWIFAGAGLVWLGIMLTLTFGDYATREKTPYRLTPSPYSTAQRPPQAARAE